MTQGGRRCGRNYGRPVHTNLASELRSEAPAAADPTLTPRHETGVGSGGAMEGDEQAGEGRGIGRLRGVGEGEEQREIETNERRLRLRE